MIAESRVGTYSLISSVETDLRIAINRYLGSNCSDSSFLGSYEEKCIKRYKNETGDNDYTNGELTSFLDFQDSFNLLCQKNDLIPVELTREVKRLSPQLEKIAAIRNRVMHVRPMDFDDYFIVSNFAKEVPITECLDWYNLKKTLGEITDNPSRLSQIEIPFEEKILNTIHNLPNPDFDETGFIGRKDEIEEIKRRLNGNNKVVTIIGDGGIGKSALALKIAYDLLDAPDCAYEAIVWVEAKKYILTESGVITIRDNVTPIKIIKDINSQYSSTTSDDVAKETIGYLKEYKTLLIIDNLETILSDAIRNFIREASLHASILITSRIGLSELEFRVEVSGLRTSESSRLLRQYGKIKGVKSVSEIDNDLAKSIACELHNNPLAIRWYVYSIAAGKSPTSLTQNQSELLNFCLGNVYEHLSEEERSILEVCLSHRGDTISEAEIYYLAEKSNIITKTAISRLLSTTFLKLSFKKTANGMECHYCIPEFARQYLINNRVVSPERYKEIQEKLNGITWSSAKIAQYKVSDTYEIHSIEAESASERISAKILSDALRLCRRDKYDPQIINLLLEAQRFAPGYIDAYKVSGFIRSEMGDYLGAEEDYRAALQIDPANKKILYFYAGFLLMQVSDPVNALIQVEKLVSIDKQSIEPRLLLCRCLAETGNLDRGIELLRPIAIDRNLSNAKIRRSSKMLLMKFLHRRSHYEFTTLHDNNSSFASLFEAMQVFREAHERGDADELIIKTAEKVIRELKNCSLRSGNHEKIKASIAESEHYNSVVSAHLTFNEFAAETHNSQAISSMPQSLDYQQQKLPLDVNNIKLEMVVEGKVIATHPSIQLAFGNRIYGSIPGRFLHHRGYCHREEIHIDSRIKSVVKKIKIKPDNSVSLTLSRIELMKNPWDDIFKHHSVGEILTGTVANFADFGVFVEFESGYVSLVHRSDISWYEISPKFQSLYSKGDMVTVRIVNINQTEQQIGASIKSCFDNPWEKICSIHPIGSEAPAQIAAIENGAIFLKFGTEFIGKAKHVLGKQMLIGQSLHVKIKEYDLEKRIILVSIK